MSDRASAGKGSEGGVLPLEERQRILFAAAEAADDAWHKYEHDHAITLEEFGLAMESLCAAIDLSFRGGVLIPDRDAPIAHLLPSQPKPTPEDA